MDISVIISTYNGMSKLPVILSSLEKQSCKDFELIIVVDGSADGTVEMLKNRENRFQQQKIIFQENGGRAAVRNTGVKNASGELLIFFDDDIIADENCIRDHFEYHRRTGFKDILTGEVIDAAVETADNKMFLDYKKYVAASWNRNLFDKRKELEKNIYYAEDYIAGADFSLTKKLFNGLGGLDESLNRMEDFEFGIRAKENGVRTVAADKYATVIHRDSDNDFKTWILKGRVAEENRAVVYAKDPERFRKLAPLRITKKNVFIKMLLGLFANNLSYNFIASDSFVKKIFPKKLLYRLYDIIVVSNARYYPDKVTL